MLGPFKLFDVITGEIGDVLHCGQRRERFAGINLPRGRLRFEPRCPAHVRARVIGLAGHRIGATIDRPHVQSDSQAQLRRQLFVRPLGLNDHVAKDQRKQACVAY